MIDGVGGPAPAAIPHTLVVARIALVADSWLDFEAAWVSAGEAGRCLDAVRGEVEWGAREIVLYGKRMMPPRLVGWAGEVPYRYSARHWIRAPSPTRSAGSPNA